MKHMCFFHSTWWRQWFATILATLVFACASNQQSDESALLSSDAEASSPEESQATVENADNPLAAELPPEKNNEIVPLAGEASTEVPPTVSAEETPASSEVVPADIVEQAPTPVEVKKEEEVGTAPDYQLAHNAKPLATKPAVPVDPKFDDMPVTDRAPKKAAKKARKTAANKKAKRSAPAATTTAAASEPTTPASTGSTPSGDTGEYVVVPGDTLMKISRKIYGSVRQWKQLASQNQLDPARPIFPGDTLVFEKNAQSQAFVENYAKRDQVKVAKGDTLFKIAEKLYGDGSYWKSIWKMNRDTIKNPNHLAVNQVVMVLPEETGAPQAQAH